jgi:hypothetical protein
MSPIYNSLPHINEAAKRLPYLQSSVLTELKALLVDHQVEAQFGIVFVHRHFTLQEVEQVVDLTGPGTVVSSVFHNGQPDSKVVEEYHLQVPDHFAVIPVRFLVREELIPYEFKCVSKDEESSFREHVENLSQSFINEWFGILQRNDAVDTMGLVDLSTETAIDGLEISDAERRVSLITTNPEMMEGMESIPSVWQTQLENPVRACDCGGAFPKPPPMPGPIIRIDPEIVNEKSIKD